MDFLPTWVTRSTEQSALSSAVCPHRLPVPPPAVAHRAAVPACGPGSLWAPLPAWCGCRFAVSSFLSPSGRLVAALPHLRPGRSCRGLPQPPLENLPGDMSQKVTAIRGHPAIRQLPHPAPWGGCPATWAGSSVCHRFSRSASGGELTALKVQVLETPSPRVTSWLTLLSSPWISCPTSTAM